MSPRLIPFSYSSLKKFETCPKQYSEIVVYKRFKDEYTSSKGDYGDRFHKAAQSYLDEGGLLDVEFEQFREALDVIRASPGQKLAEYKMAIRHDGTPTAWNADDRWFQGITDLLIIGESSTARLMDFKTGQSKYADTDQLELMSLLIFAHFPHITYVKGRLLFINERIPCDRNIKIEEKERLEQKYREKDAKRLAAIDADNFPARESGLCRKNCVVTSCVFNGKR